MPAQCRAGAAQPGLRPPGAGCRRGGGARRGSWRPDPAATREAISRGRPETAEPAAGPDVSAPLAWAPALDSAPVPLRAVPLRSGSRSARARLGLRWRPPRRARGRRRRRTMARAQALVLALTFQLCAPETETPAGKRASVAPKAGSPRPRAVAQLGRKCEFGVAAREEPAPGGCLSAGCAIPCSRCPGSATVLCP